MEFDTTAPQWQTGDKNSFAHSFTKDNLTPPIAQAIKDFGRELSNKADQEARAEGEKILEQLSRLKYEIQHNLQLAPITDDGAGDISAYNAEVEQRGASKWLESTWLFSGCYLFRRIQTYFSTSIHWKGYDIFAPSKKSSFRSSRDAVVELAAQYKTIISGLQSDTPLGGVTSQEDLENAERILFAEIAEICLWGNKTDLSLHANFTKEDIQKLQGAEIRKASKTKILVNQINEAFEALNKSAKEGKQQRRVDFVLDNAGFELFADLILAGYLLSTGLATTVILHPKDFPWFVSDVVPTDFRDLLLALQQAETFFQSDPAFTAEELDNLSFLYQNWTSLHQEGKLVIQTHPFWTHGGSHWRLSKTAPDLYEDLKKSDLVVFKGDLNYRKLLADVMWPPATPFSNAIGPLGHGSGLRILALRTCKADVICGLPEGKDEELRETQHGGPGPQRRWAWNGDWAVIQFCDGK